MGSTGVPSGVRFPMVAGTVSDIRKSGSGVEMVCGGRRLSGFVYARARYSMVRMSGFIGGSFRFRLLNYSVGSKRRVVVPNEARVSHPCNVSGAFFLQFSRYRSRLGPLVNGTVSFMHLAGCSKLFDVRFLQSGSKGSCFARVGFQGSNGTCYIATSKYGVPCVCCLKRAKGSCRTRLRGSGIYRACLVPRICCFAHVLTNRIKFGR